MKNKGIFDHMNISSEVLDKIKASAAQYAAKNAKQQYTIPLNQIMPRIKVTIGYQCNEEELLNCNSLNKIIELIQAGIRSEKRKAQKRSAFYDRFRHIEMLNIYADLIQKRSNL